MRKVRVGIIFGGRSGEHASSLMSERSIVDALDRERYEPVLVGIDPDGRWHLEDAGRALLGGPGAPLQLDTSAPELAMRPGGGALLPARSPGAAPIDVCFPVLHGTYGEDGTVQKKRVEILQMSMLKPSMAIMDETDSGLDIDALRVVSEGVNALAKKSS